MLLLLTLRAINSTSALLVYIFDGRGRNLRAAKPFDDAVTEVCDLPCDFFLILGKHEWIVELFKRLFVSVCFALRRNRRLDDLVHDLVFWLRT